MRIAVLGLGFMGSTHLKALRTIPGAQLAAVYSSDTAKLSGDLRGVQGNIGAPGENFDFSGVAKYSRIDALLADSSIEAIDICLPTNLHAQVAIQALRRGKHVLVEKPMALDIVECASMLAAAREHDRVLMTAQVLRFFPMYQVLAGALSPGELGPVRSAAFRRRCAAPARKAWLTDAKQSGGGVFDLLIHDVDICLRLFGMPESVSATGYVATDSGIDVIDAGLHYRGRFTAAVTGGWHHLRSFPFLMEYTVVTEGGTVDYSSAGRPPTLYHANGEEELLTMTDSDGYTAELAYFLDCCRAGKEPALCPPEESAEAVALMRLLLEARNRNGEGMQCNI
ncbi:MAG: Gfo/Idh/MocA family protein [Bryobacteraceae bacterium]